MTDSRHQYRTLLSQCSLQSRDVQAVIDGALSYLERYLRNGDDKWSGRSHQLSDVNVHGQGAVAILHLIMHRWLPLLE